MAVLGHLGKDILPGAAQDSKDISMRRAGVVVERFDAPITLAADLPGGTKYNTSNQLPAVGRLDRADEAAPAIAVTKPPLTPKLFGREKTFDPSERLKEGVWCKI